MGCACKLQEVLTVGQPPAPLSAELQHVATRHVCARDPRHALELLAERQPELVLIGEQVSVSDTLTLLGRLSASWPALPAVVLSPSPSVELAVQFVRAGAMDYLPSGMDQARLRQLVAVVKARQEAARPADRFFCELCPPGVPMVGQSEGLVRALELIHVVAESGCNPVLILGETGTGKELAARAVYVLRCLPTERLVAVNCAALTASLLESELFGHTRGAFTGADREKTGLFEVAGQGSIFLDEISEMPLELQAKLLRVVQERSFRKVGGTTDILCQATIIASSNRDLFKEAHEQRFRRDLYYRLAVFPITIPPLRAPERRGDIPLLAEYMLQVSPMRGRKEITGLAPATQEMLLRHNWPGNVRELRNVIDRALLLERSDRVQPTSIMLERPAEQPGQPPAPSAQDFSLETAEREFILRALKETGWQRTRAAALLGITRATLHTKLRRYDIKVPQASGSAPAIGEPQLAKVAK